MHLFKINAALFNWSVCQFTDVMCFVRTVHKVKIHKGSHCKCPDQCAHLATLYRPFSIKAKSSPLIEHMFILWMGLAVNVLKLRDGCVSWRLCRLTCIEKAVKNTTIFVIYRVLVYIQMFQPTTCFGLF